MDNPYLKQEDHSPLSSQRSLSVTSLSSNYSDTCVDENIDSNHFSKDEYSSDGTYSTDSEEYLSSDDEFDVSRDVLFTVYDDRYIPIKYINRGTFSRVWLTYDINDNALVAMKCIFPEFKEDALHELKINTLLNQHFNNTTDELYLLTQKSSFIYKDQICIIYDIAGICIYDLLDHFENKIPINIVKKITRDILTGINNLHRTRLIHTDLKPENILLNIYNRGIKIYKKIVEQDNNFRDIYEQLMNSSLPPNFKEMNKSKKKNIKRKLRTKILLKLCQIIKKSISTIINAYSDEYFKKHSSISELSDIDLDTLCRDSFDIKKNKEEYNKQHKTFKEYLKEVIIEEHDIKHIKATIIDFGNCEYFESRKHIQDEISIRCYRPPENFLNSFYNSKADIWTIGCLVFQFITGETMFSIDVPENDIERDCYYLNQIRHILGNIPIKMRKESEYKTDLFSKQGILNFVDEPKNIIKIENILSNDFFVDKEESIHIANFLSFIFVYDHNKRADSVTLLSHSWLQ